jgi:hypothetical protein
VYVLPLPEKFPAVPFVTVISPTAKLVTDSLNVKVTENGERLVGSPALVVTVRVGCTES